MKNRKLTALDRFLLGLSRETIHRVILVLLFAGSLIIRWKLAPETTISSDYELYIKGWPDTYRELGFVAGMRQVIGDYYVPFNIMYAVIGLSPWEPWVLASLFSCIFDYLIAGLVYFLLRDLFLIRGAADAPLKAAYMSALTCYLPFIFMESALWKQCDGFYIFFALLAVYLLLIKDRPTLAFAMLGISFSFKLQSVFFFPFFVLLYFLKKNFSILQFLWIPGCYLVAGLPAVLCGRGLRATYFTYFMQMTEGTDYGTTSFSENYGMVANYPNAYNFGLDEYLGTLALPAVIFTMMLLALSVALAIRRDLRDPVRLLYLLAWQIWTCVMFLPSMHDRYDYGAVLLFSLLIALLPRESVVPACVLNIGTFIIFIRAARMDAVGVSLHLLALIYLAAFFLTSWILVHRLILLREDGR